MHPLRSRGRIAALPMLALTVGVLAGLVVPARADGVTARLVEPMIPLTLAATTSVEIKLAPAMVQEFDARLGTVRTEVYSEEFVLVPLAATPATAPKQLALALALAQVQPPTP